jgi:hypothetical protein
LTISINDCLDWTKVIISPNLSRPTLAEKKAKHGIDEDVEIFNRKSDALGEIIAENRGNHGQICEFAQF